MGKRIGICCILLGIVCLLASVGFVIYNRYEANSGAQESRTLLQDVQEKMEEAGPSEAGQLQPMPEELPAAAPLETEPREMETVPAGNYDSIGVLSIPVL